MKTVKRAIAVLLCLVMAAGIFSVTSFAILPVMPPFDPVTPERPEGEREYGEFNFTVNEGEVTITGLTDKAGSDLVIPPELAGYPVIAIGNSAFYSNNVIETVTIPASVKLIDVSAFKNCEKLKSAVFEENSPVKVIYDNTFSGCINLESVILPDSLECIESEAFSDCKKLKSIDLPETLVYIRYGVFFNSGIESDKSKYEDGALYIGNWLISVDSEKRGKFTVKDGTGSASADAIAGCEYITEVIIPASLIGEMSEFYACDSLEAITVDEKNSAYCSEDGVLFNKDMTEIIRYPINKPDSKYEIPDGVVTVSDGAFDYCKNLRKILIPASVKNIDLSYCSSLKRIEYDGTCKELYKICRWNTFDDYWHDGYVFCHCSRSSIIENIFYPLIVHFMRLINYYRMDFGTF